MSAHVTVAVERMLSGVEMFHVDRYGPHRDLWVYRDDGGRLRPVTPRRGLPVPLPNRPSAGWPPLGVILAAASRECAQGCATVLAKKDAA